MFTVTMGNLILYLVGKSGYHHRNLLLISINRVKNGVLWKVGTSSGINGPF